MKVGIDGRYSFTRIRNNNDLRHYGAGITVETLAEWDFDRDQIWLVREPLSVIVHTKTTVTKYMFAPPYLTDLASVPRRLRSAIDNDDLRLIAPALVHDFNFATHSKSFRNSNTLFRQMIRVMGASPFKAFICWLAVSTPIGRRRYNKKSEELAAYCRETCDVREVKK